MELTREQVIDLANERAQRLGYDGWEAFEAAHPDGVIDGTTDEISLAMIIGMPWGD